MPAHQRVRCVVIHPETRRDGAPARPPGARLEEAIGLAEALSLPVVHAEIVRLGRLRPSTYFGKGTVERLKDLLGGGAAETGRTPLPAADGRTTLAFVDAAITPIQQRNLERAWNCKVIDRTGLILEIFGARARTGEGKMQVELAACTYQRSRLVRTWTHLERQRGGFGFLAGPGETQIETDRRLLEGRILRLKRELESVRRTRELHRRARRRVPYEVVALVGYTNAGKSTLFNALTAATVTVRRRLFETLDPTMRSVRLPSGRKMILSDTVGFISDLPHELVNAFHATLEEVSEADMILHVRDISHPDTEAQRADVLQVLSQLGREHPNGNGVVEVLNKIDLLAEAERASLRNRADRSNDGAIPLCALTGEGVDALLDAIDRRLAQRGHVVDTVVDVADGASLAWLYANGEVLLREDGEKKIRLRVRLDPAAAARYAKRKGPETRAGREGLQSRPN